jgi:hypothetical protein
VLANLRKRGKRESESGGGAKGVGELGLGLQDAARVEALKECSMHGIRPIEQVNYVAPLGCVPYRKKKEPTEEVGLSADGPSRKRMVAAPFSSDICSSSNCHRFSGKRKEEERKRFRKISNRFQTFSNLDLIQNNL